MKANILKEVRLGCGYTLSYVAEAIGTSKQTIHRYESGVISNIPDAKIEALARVYGVSPSYLMGWGEEKGVPMLGEIACGEPHYAYESRGDYIPASGVDADFCLVAKGSSMTGARIYEGDIVFVKRQSTVDNGEIAAVIIDDEATLKRVYYYPEDGKLILTPENPEYSPMVYIGEELASVRILGKAVAFQSLIR